MIARLLFVLVVAVTVSFSDEVTAHAEWPQWRGPTRDGADPGPTWPESIGEDRLKQAWRVELGPSYSGPIVADGKVFTTATVDKQTEHVYAYDVATGERLWEASWQGAMEVPFFAARNGSWIRATPVYSDGLLYVAGIRDVLVCLDAADGSERWRVDLAEKYGVGVPMFGCASSPIVHGDGVFIQAAGGFCKLSKQTGEVAWRVAVDHDDPSDGAFSSPAFTEIAGRPQMLVQTRSDLKGIDPETGAEFFSQPIEAFRGMNILTPTVFGDAVFTSAHSGKSQLWRLTAAASGVEVDEAWEDKAKAYMSSPVVVDGHAYMHLQNQRITCLDLEKGEETWRSKPYSKYQSMVTQGDRILALDSEGELLLLKADPAEFTLLERRRVSEDECWAYLAVSGGKVFVRELNALAVYDWD